jgi:hypothetical protein
VILQSPLNPQLGESIKAKPIALCLFALATSAFASDNCDSDSNRYLILPTVQTACVRN